MSDQITHWAESLQVGDKCLATIRHKNDGTKNMHKVEVIIFENNINEQNVCAWFPEFKVILPYNDLSKIQNNLTMPEEEITPIDELCYDLSHKQVLSNDGVVRCLDCNLTKISATHQFNAPVKPVDEWKGIDRIGEAKGSFYNVEVLFEDGSIVDYMRNDWPFSVSVGWRFKNAAYVKPVEVETDLYFIRQFDSTNYYWCKCENCGWEDSSEFTEGCHAIADTGDCTDPVCPICGCEKLEGDSAIDPDKQYEGIVEVKIPIALILSAHKKTIDQLNESLERFRYPAPVKPSIQSGLEDAAKKLDSASWDYAHSVEDPYELNTLKFAFESGAEWQAQQAKQPVMQWVSVEDRLPEEEGDYFVVKNNLLKEVMYHTGTKSSNSRWRENVKVWLEEPPIQ